MSRRPERLITLQSGYRDADSVAHDVAPSHPFLGSGPPLELLSRGSMMTTFHWLGPGSDLMISPSSMDRLYERFFGYGATTQEDGTPTYALPVDILETEDPSQLHATVAGVPQDAVEVTFEGGRLTIAVKAAPLQLQGTLIRQERPWGNWSRKLELPTAVDSGNIHADVEDGGAVQRVGPVLAHNCRRTQGTAPPRRTSRKTASERNRN